DETMTACLSATRAALGTKGLNLGGSWSVSCTRVSRNAKETDLRCGGTDSPGGRGISIEPGPGRAEFQTRIRDLESDFWNDYSFAFPGSTRMTTPERVVLVTEQPLLILNFRELLQAAGLDCTNVVLSPEDVPEGLRVDQNCLVMVDSDCELGWETLSALRLEMPLSRFVIWCSRVTPQVVQKAMD